MGVQKGDTVSIHYLGRLDNGEEFDSSFSKEPIEFTVGIGEVVAAIDDGVFGLEPGEKRIIKVTPEKGFGPRHDELIRAVPRSLLGDQSAVPGEPIEIQTEDGQTLIAVVEDIDETNLVLDLNHPLSGKNLEFEIHLLTIEQRAA